MSHEHRYFLAQIKKEFIPIDPEEYGESNLYSLIEYAYHMCQCGDTKKIRVTMESDYNEADA